MDFFQNQQRAKNRTTLLIALFAIAVCGLIAAVYALFVCVVLMAGGDDALKLGKNYFFDPTLFPLVVGGVSILVLGGSFFKTMQLSVGGGKAVAEMMGGRLVSPDTNDLAKRRLMNIVEEISLASGVPVPPVYIMDNEAGINAFAAGSSPSEAVVAVNRGTMELLTRDELQGVLAHEFSHILNGDMRIGIRLIGVLFGLQILALVGYYAMRMSYYAALGGNSRSSDKGGGAGIGLVMLLVGLGVMVIGYVGVLFSAIIKAAVSRQREYLADASAVQFTRMTDGIAGALKKIGSPNVGSAVQNEHAAEASHLFFGNVSSLFSLGGLFATHPDLTTRIRRLDPSFDGKFPQRVLPVNIRAEGKLNPPQKSRTLPHPSPLSEGQGDGYAGLEKFSTIGILDGIGQFGGAVDQNRVSGAADKIGKIPESISEAARNPLTAKATFYALLLDQDSAIRQKQLSSLAGMETDFVIKETQRLFGDEISALADEARIPLAQKISSALRQLTLNQYQQFSAAVDSLIAADQKMDLFEYTLKAVLLRDLDVFFGLAKKLSVRYYRLDQVMDAITIVTAYLAYWGHDTQEQAQRAFHAALRDWATNVSMPQPAECSVSQFDRGLRKLAETEPGLKKTIFAACLTCVEHDALVTKREAELIRAIAAMLAIPMPEFK